MTKPKQAKQNTSGVRTYVWPPPATLADVFKEPEFEVVSVTSALDGGLPKPALVGWAAKVTAEHAVESIDIVKAMIEKGQEKEAIKYLKDARFNSSGTKADRGTIVHAALEAAIDGKPLSLESIEGMLKEAHVPPGVWKSTGGMIEAVMRFMQDEEPEVIWSEKTVYSRTHGYAGTADLIAKMKVGDTVVPVVVDIKTSARVYDDVALQLCAYARADFVGLDDGTEAPLVHDGKGDDGVYIVNVDQSFRPIQHGVVLRPMAGGTYEKVVFNLTDEVFELFLACLHTATHRSALEGTRRP